MKPITVMLLVLAALSMAGCSEEPWQYESVDKFAGNHDVIYKPMYWRSQKRGKHENNGHPYQG